MTALAGLIDAALLATTIAIANVMATPRNGKHCRPPRVQLTLRRWQ